MVYGSMTTRISVRSLAVTLAVLAAGCTGSSGSTAPVTAPAAPPTGVQGTTITIAAGGVATPKNLLVKVGAQVTFVNNDTMNHLMFSDPHPEHTDCPELNQVGFLAPGQSLQSGNLNIVRTCGFHDHNLPAVASLQGSITIQ
jgi:plastocyanin